MTIILSTLTIEEDVPMTTEKIKIFKAELVKAILREVRPNEREEVKGMLKRMNEMLHVVPPEERKRSRKLVAKTARR